MKIVLSWSLSTENRSQLKFIDWKSFSVEVYQVNIFMYSCEKNHKWKIFHNWKILQLKILTWAVIHMFWRKNCLWKKSLKKTLSLWKISQTVTQILNFFEMKTLTSLVLLYFCESFHKVPSNFRLTNKYSRGSTWKRFQSENFHKC